MVELTGSSLTPEQVRAVAVDGEQVSIATAAVERMKASRHAVEELAAGEKPIYAVNTGVGFLSGKRISAEDLAQLQRNVLRSHACGVGAPLKTAEVRAMMLIRANVLAKGLSGIRPLIAERLCALLDSGVTPVVPSRGSVGASGDLVPLAHMALVLLGEGKAEIKGQVLSGREALSRAGIEPVTLASKEGISLVNGTQAMLAVGCLEMLACETLLNNADVICALTLDTLQGTPRAFDPRIHEARPHPGQLRSARILAGLAVGSEIYQTHIDCPRVQDAYSLRCTPQVHGAVRDSIAEARRAIEIELNSATDNPLVFGHEILSGGNFHGQILALQFDYLAIALTTLSAIAERRIDRLVNPYLNEGLPAFLAPHPGLESGFMMLQVTAASLVAENRVLASPASTGSITTSGNKEDYVSMGMTAALKLGQVAVNTRSVLAIEAITAARALDCLRPLKSSVPLETAHVRIRTHSAPYTEDRSLAEEIEAVERWLADGGLEDLALAVR